MESYTYSTLIPLRTAPDYYLIEYDISRIQFGVAFQVRLKTPQMYP